MNKNNKDYNELNTLNKENIGKIIIIEGLDNTGKTTQINELLESENTIFNKRNTLIIKSNAIFSKEVAYKFYDDMFSLMFTALKNNYNIIFDRAHLGEYVYSPLYRNYDGNYVFTDIEKKYLSLLKEFKNDIYLFVFIDSDFIKILNREDGNSLSNLNKNKIREETKDFIKAYRKSKIYNKQLIDLNQIRNENPKDLTIDNIYMIHNMIYNKIKEGV